MRKFRKVYNLVLIFILLGIYLSTNLSYAGDISHLRVPISSDYNRLKEINSNQAVKDEAVSEKENALASKNNMSRREFFKRSARYGAFALIMATLPILLTGNTEEILNAIEKLDSYTLSFDYLHSLTKKEGSAYIQGIYYAVNANKIDRNQAEKFLRKIFNDEYLLWMRVEAVRELIKLDMLTQVEIDKFVASIPDESILVAIAQTLGKKNKNADLVGFLINWERFEGNLTVRIAIIKAIGELGSKYGEAEDYIIELSKSDMQTTNGLILEAIIIALGKANTNRTIERLRKWKGRELEWWSDSRDGALTYAEIKNYPLDKLIELFERAKGRGRLSAIISRMAESDREDEVVDFLIKVYGKVGIPMFDHSIIDTLGKIGTPRAVEYLIFLIKQQHEPSWMISAIAEALSIAGTREATTHLQTWVESESRPGIWVSVAESMGATYTESTLPTLIKSIKDHGVRYGSVYQLYSACGYKSIELLKELLKEEANSSLPSLSGIGYYKEILTKLVGDFINKDLRWLNDRYDFNEQDGEKGMKDYFKRLEGKPDILYPILALSQETTSHSFPLAYNYLRKYIIEKYENFDIFRYISEEWHSMFLPEFLFTLTIFDKLEENFADTQYSPRELAELILSDKEIQNLVQKPALFSKILSNIMNFKDIRLKDAFIDRIVKLGKKNIELKVLISLMLEFKVIAKDDRFIPLTIDLPSYNPAWRSPQKDWLKDDVLSVGLYWSTAKGGEKAHYEQFPEIFTDGSKVNSFYSNFGGYVDKSKDPNYKDKLIKNGARGILVKEFSGTGRKIEIYLYSSLDAIKASPHSITISRGHAGERDNTDYPGLPGTLRFASHCRSINDSDELIKANPDSPTITITGTGRAQETNPTLYYLLEYLGNKEIWGNWQTIKEYIEPHIPQSIRKYNFPTDDISFIYAAILQKLKPQEIQKSSSLNIQMGVMGALKSLESLGNKL